MKYGGGVRVNKVTLHDNWADELTPTYGTVYEYELIYYPTTTDAGGYKVPQPDNVVGRDLNSHVSQAIDRASGLDPMQRDLAGSRDQQCYTIYYIK